MNIHCYLTLVLLLLHKGVPSHTADGECGVVGDCETLVLAFTITPSLAECIIYGSLVFGCNYVSWNRITGTCLAYPGCEEPLHSFTAADSNSGDHGWTYSEAEDDGGGKEDREPSA